MDPNFDVQYDEAKHGEYLRRHLKVSHLKPATAALLTRLIMKYWCVFNPDGLRYPVIGYKCHIDTGDARPIACKNPNYGPRESIEMDKHIAVLEVLEHIEQTFEGEWLSCALLAPKPHQESCYQIEKFKWRFW